MGGHEPPRPGAADSDSSRTRSQPGTKRSIFRWYRVDLGVRSDHAPREELAAAVEGRGHWRRDGRAARYEPPGTAARVTLIAVAAGGHRERVRAVVISAGRAQHCRPAATADEAVRWAERGRMTEIYRSRDGRFSIERAVDRYLIYDERLSTQDEVWSCRTVVEVYDWLDGNQLSIADFDEV